MGLLRLEPRLRHLLGLGLRLTSPWACSGLGFMGLGLLRHLLGLGLRLRLS